MMNFELNNYYYTYGGWLTKIVSKTSDTLEVLHGSYTKNRLFLHNLDGTPKLSDSDAPHFNLLSYHPASLTQFSDFHTAEYTSLYNETLKIIKENPRTIIDNLKHLKEVVNGGNLHLSRYRTQKLVRDYKLISSSDLSYGKHLLSSFLGATIDNTKDRNLIIEGVRRTGIPTYLGIYEVNGSIQILDLRLLCHIDDFRQYPFPELEDAI